METSSGRKSQGGETARAKSKEESWQRNRARRGALGVTAGSWVLKKEGKPLRVSGKKMYGSS